jgi:hypothetical protein
MEEKPPSPISAAEHGTRQNRLERIARQLGFVGIVEYRHVSTTSGGAQYWMGPTVKHDVLVAFAKAYERDGNPDDFSLEAIIAHERGHQLLCRHELLRRNTPKEMSPLTEEILASLVGAGQIAAGGILLTATAPADYLLAPDF